MSEEPPLGARLGGLQSQRAMSVFRQESLSEEVNRESATFTTVAGGSVALQFKASISSTSSSSTQTTSETVVQRMVGECLGDRSGRVGDVPAVGERGALCAE